MNTLQPQVPPILRYLCADIMPVPSMGGKPSVLLYMFISFLLVWFNQYFILKFSTICNSHQSIAKLAEKGA